MKGLNFVGSTPLVSKIDVKPAGEGISRRALQDPVVL